GILRDGTKGFARGRAVAHGVVTVRGVEEINVGAPRVEALVDDLAHQVEAGGSHRATRAGHLEEFRFGKLPSLGRVRHENRLERAVLAPQALYDPEEERLRELAIAVGHA